MSDVKRILDQVKENMHKAVNHTGLELTRIRAGKATPSMLDGIEVNYYGSLVPLSQVASVNTPDARTLAIKPWEKGMITEIEKAIMKSDLGLNPQNDGEMVRLSIPPLTEERRKNLVKQAKTESENGKISIRNIRKDSNEQLKKLLKEGSGVSEDEVKSAEEQVQKTTDLNIKAIDDLLAAKEKDIMTI